MFVMGKLVFQHVYMSAIEHGHNVKPDADSIGFGANDPSGFDADENGSGSGFLPFDPFPQSGAYSAQ